MEVKSAAYIYEWAKYLIILNTFQSSSQFYFSEKQRGKVEEGVHVEFEWNSIRFGGVTKAGIGSLIVVVKSEHGRVFREVRAEEVEDRAEILRLVS